MNKLYYFAYGSNMNISQMKERCPDAEKLGKAILNGYKFIINTRGVATIIESKGGIVEGGLYKISDKSLSSLDYYEGVRNNYYFRKDVEVNYEGEKIKAITYIATDQKEGKPRNGYIEKIIKGAEDFCLSKDYLQVIRKYIKNSDDL